MNELNEVFNKNEELLLKMVDVCNVLVHLSLKGLFFI